jgi:hypothetical protein
MGRLMDKLTGTGQAKPDDDAPRFPPRPPQPKRKPVTNKAVKTISATLKELGASFEELELVDPYLVDAQAFARQADAMVDRYMVASGIAPKPEGEGGSLKP